MDAGKLAADCGLYLESLKLAGVEYVARFERPANFAAPGPSAVADEVAKPVDPRALNLIATEAIASKCKKCKALFSTRSRVVFGEGPLDAKLFVIGEGPSSEDDLAGKPFQGKIGELLDNILKKLGLDRSEVYFTTAIKCKTAGGRLPKADECANCSEYLEAQLREVKPKAIAAFGATAGLLLTGDGVLKEWNGIPAIATLSLAYLLANEKARIGAWADLRLLLPALASGPA